MAVENILIKKVKSHPSELVFKVHREDGVSNEFTMFHSTHSLIRSAQRGLSDFKIAATLTYGTTISKQGLDYYVLRSCDLPDHLKHLKSELENTVILLSADGCMITGYKGNKSFRKIWKKTKKNIDLK